MSIVEDCLGMEFELSCPKIILNLSETPTKEQNIKGWNILEEDGGLLKLTLDPRVGFNESGNNENMAIEFILDHTQCSIQRMDFQKTGQKIQNYITSHSSKSYILSRIIPNSYFTIPGSREICPAHLSSEGCKIESRTVMIHVTCACPLRSIGKLPFFYCEGIEWSLHGSEEVNGFIYLIAEMCEGAGGVDIKQKMSIMNRTSFGAIFNLFSPTEKDTILKNLYSLKGNYKPIFSDYTFDNFYTYLYNLRAGVQTVEDDPTYIANKKMFLGISALGDTFVEKGEEKWPIFEFRNGGNPLVSYISEYFKNIKNELDNRDKEVPNFVKWEH